MGKGWKWLVAIAALAALAGLVAVNLRSLGGGNAVAVKGLRIEPADLTVRVLAPADLEAAEEREVRAGVSSVQINLMAAAGDIVQAGQVLARLDTGSLEERVSRERAALAGAKSQLAQLERQAKLGPAQADGRLATARTNLNMAEVGLERAQIAVQTQERAAQERADQAKAQLELAAGLLAAATAAGADTTEAAGRVLAAQDDLAAAVIDWKNSDPIQNRDLAEARLRVESARVALRQAELDGAVSSVLPAQLTAAREQVRAAEESLARAQADLELARIVAPINGVVLAVAVKEGQPVQPGALLFTVADTRRLIARARVDEVDIGQVAKGQSVQITSLAHPGVQFDGVVTVVNPQGRRSGEGTAASYVVDIQLDAKDGSLRPGMNVDADIAVATRAGVLAIPVEALRDQGGRKVVWVADDRGTARQREVSVGLTTRSLVEITGGLTAGDQVLTGPTRVLRDLLDGQSVRVESE